MLTTAISQAKQTRRSQGLELFTAVFVFVLSFAVHAKAAPICADLFKSPLGSTAIARLQNLGDEAGSLVRRLRARPFDIKKFDQALAHYRVRGPMNLAQPKTREQRIAFLHYVSETSDRQPYDLELWARQATPKEMRRLADAIGRFDVNRGFSPSRIDDIYWKLTQFSARSPNSIKNLRKLGVTQMDRIALEQWVTKELASASALEAFKKLGLIRDQNMAGRWRDLLRDHPNAVTNIATAGMMVFESVIFQSPISFFRYSKMRVTKLDPELRAIVERDGFDAAYPLLKERYGHLVGFDRGIYFARRAVTVGLMSFMLIHMYPTVMRHALPEVLLQKDENAVQLTVAVVKYYSELAEALVLDRLQGTDDKAIHVMAPKAVTIPRPQVAAPVDSTKISAHRVPMTFETQLKQKSPSQSDDDVIAAAHEEALTTAARANLARMNSLDFSDPTER